MIYWLFNLLSYLPLCIIYVVTAIGSKIAFHVIGYRKSVVKDNLRHAFPDWNEKRIEKLTCDIYQSLGEVCAEIIKLNNLKKSEIENRITIEGEELQWRHQPSIIIASHQGNWEWLFQRLVLAMQVPMYGVYKPLHNASTDRFTQSIRTQFGAEIVPYKKFGEMVLRHRQHSCLMMGDQAPSLQSNIEWINFFGRKVPFYLGVARLSAICKLPVFYISSKRIARGRYIAKIENMGIAKKGEEKIFLQNYVNRIEHSIIEQPHTWLWTHRRWKKVQE